MSTRNLEAIFRPKSVALIGASTRDHAVGTVVARNLIAGGFEGPILPVNPHHASVGGVLAYPDIAHLPVIPDLAVICTPAETVPALIGQLGARGTRGAIVVSAGFKELGNAAGASLEQQMLDAAHPHLLRIVGPNCLGVLSTPSGLNASFAPETPRKGGVAFVAQSGAMLTAVLDWASARGIGFSHLVSLGDMADVDFGDMLDFLATDAATSAILLYVEAVTEARKFMSAARAAARSKPVIVIKAGRHPAAAKAALSHTGALAGADGVYDAAFRRAGLLRVNTLDALFDAVETLGKSRLPQGERLAILTNGGGAGVLATDSLLDRSGALAELSPPTIAALDGVLPATWSHGNPVDIIGDAPPERYAAALKLLLRAPEVDCVLVLNCPTAVASGADAARAVIATAQSEQRTVLTNWLGADAAAEPRNLFGRAGLPSYETPDQAVRGFMHIVEYRRGQKRLMEVPSSDEIGIAPRDAEAKRIVAQALAAKREWLGAVEIAALLDCYGIPSPRCGVVPDADGAASLAASFKGPVVLKIVSPDIVHKSDIGGVTVNIEGADAVRKAAAAMLERVTGRQPGARIEGLLVQDYVQRPSATELIAGMTVDPTFGPVMLFGRGGTAVQIVDDKALALAPINGVLAREMIAQTRVHRVLAGYRDHLPADLDAIALTLVKLSQLACDFDEIAEMEINPLLADADGVLALDTRIRLKPFEGVRGERLALKPYPRELEREETIGGVDAAFLRPVRPQDAPAFEKFVARLSPEDMRMRFFSPRHLISDVMLARLTQIDYDREMAFVLFEKNTGEILGIVRLSANPDGDAAELAVIVRTDCKRKGLGRRLLQRMIEYARSRGIREVSGDILQENTAMLALAKAAGFEIAGEGPGSGVVRAILKLRAG